MQDRYAALVKGPSALFPRGFLWLIPAWFAAIALLLWFKGQTPPWYGDAALLGLALAALTLLLVLTTVRNNAFVADNGGIWLGLRAGATRRLGRRRRIRQVPWPQIEQLTVVRRSYGTRLEVVLGEAAPIGGWPRALGRIVANGLLVIIPFTYLVRSPGLLTPRPGPPRYRIPLYDVTVAEVRHALAQLAPAAVSIVEMPRWRILAMKRRRARRPLPYAPGTAGRARVPAAARTPVRASATTTAAAPVPTPLTAVPTPAPRTTVPTPLTAVPTPAPRTAVPTPAPRTAVPTPAPLTAVPTPAPPAAAPTPAALAAAQLSAAAVPAGAQTGAPAAAAADDQQTTHGHMIA